MLAMTVLDELCLHERNVFCDRMVGEVDADQSGKGSLIAGTGLLMSGTRRLRRKLMWNKAATGLLNQS
jgi:hypothetical protein